MSMNMLVRDPGRGDIVKFESHGWHAEHGPDGPADVFEATAIFSCGCRRTARRSIDYRIGEREDLMRAILESPDGEPSRAVVDQADTLRRKRWSLRQDAYGQLQSVYQRGLAPHVDHESEEVGYAGNE